GDAKVKSVEAVWAQWEQLKRAEKHGTKHARPSTLDGIPKHLPALLRAEKLVKKARRAGLLVDKPVPKRRDSKSTLARQLFTLVERAQGRGWSAEELLRTEARKRESTWRNREKRKLNEPARGHGEKS